VGLFPAYDINPRVRDTFWRLFLLYSPPQLQQPKPKPVFEQVTKLRVARQNYPRGTERDLCSNATMLFKTVKEFHE
jgi:hypothetical protein